MEPTFSNIAGNGGVRPSAERLHPPYMSSALSNNVVAHPSLKDWAAWPDPSAEGQATTKIGRGWGVAAASPIGGRLEHPLQPRLEQML